jgi:hypothetical protein
MKNALLVATVLYLVAFLRTAYFAVISLIVHFANKNLGHQDDYFGEVMNITYLVLSVVFGIFTAFGWYAYRHPNLHALIKWLVFFPLLIVGLYAIFGFVILIFGTGAWN